MQCGFGLWRGSQPVGKSLKSNTTTSLVPDLFMLYCHLLWSIDSRLVIVKRHLSVLIGGFPWKGLFQSHPPTKQIGYQARILLDQRETQRHTDLYYSRWISFSSAWLMFVEWPCVLDNHPSLVEVSDRFRHRVGRYGQHITIVVHFWEGTADVHPYKSTGIHYILPSPIQPSSKIHDHVLKS